MAESADKVSRRRMLKVVGAASILPLVPSATEAQHGRQLPASAPAASDTGPGAWSNALFFFNDPEARCIEVAVDRLIPPDDEHPGAAAAGVLYYIDRQLAGAYGSGARMYLEGPWMPDAPAEQGYQLRYSPANLYRISLSELASVCRQRFSREFADLAVNQQDDVLKGLETGDIALPTVPSPVFFETLLANTIEGFFADPVYEGNRNMASWRMIGFPGAYAQYLDLVDDFGVLYQRRPLSIGDQQARQHYLASHRGVE